MMDMSPQSLIDSGMAWRLEGYVGRQCMAALEAGAAVLGPEGHRDFWGNYVPSRHEVKPGTMGSVRFHHDEMGHPAQFKNCRACRRLRAER
jgi:hypothetical protein